jgi:hypothetical protein
MFFLAKKFSLRESNTNFLEKNHILGQKFLLKIAILQNMLSKTQKVPLLSRTFWRDFPGFLERSQKIREKGPRGSPSLSRRNLKINYGG